MIHRTRLHGTFACAVAACSVMYFLSARTLAASQDDKQCCVCTLGQMKWGVSWVLGTNCGIACVGGAATEVMPGVPQTPKPNGSGPVACTSINPPPPPGAPQPLPPNYGSLSAGIGGDKGAEYARNRCQIALTISPSPAFAGKSVDITFSAPNLGGGYCNIYSGGLVEWGDGQTTLFKMVGVQNGDACSGPEHSRLASTVQTLSHRYQTPGTYELHSFMDGSFKDVGGKLALPC
jgi:hypothetical protein